MSLTLDSISTFSFEIWLQKNDLIEYKELFVHYGLNTVDSINTLSSNYHQLLSDSKIVSNPLLISKIALTVNNLQTTYEALRDIVISKMESKLEELVAYEEENIDDTDHDLDDEDDDYSQSQLFNHRLYEIEKIKDEKQLNEIRIQIQDLFLSIFKVLKKKEQIILKKFKNIQHEILDKYNKIIDKMKQNDDEISTQKEYLREHINYHKSDEIHTTRNGVNDKSHNSILEMKQMLPKITKIIKKNDTKTRKLVAEKQNILDEIYFAINNEIREYIIDNIDELICFERNNASATTINKIDKTDKKRKKHRRERKASSLRSIKSKSANMTEKSVLTTHSTSNIHAIISKKHHHKSKRRKHRRHSSNIESSSKDSKGSTPISASAASGAIDLINMSPNKIKRLKYIQQEDHKYNMIDIELTNTEKRTDISNIGILYLYHCNELDEKENTVINDTIESENGEQKEFSDTQHDAAPNTPFYKNDDDINVTSFSKLSQWKKCKDLSINAMHGKSHLLMKIPIANNSMNVDCVWIKLIDFGKQSASAGSIMDNNANKHNKFPSSIAPITKLMVESGQTVKLQSSVEYNFDEIIIEKNGILTVNCTSKGYLLLKIRDKLEIHSHGKLNVTGLGHKGGKRYLNGEGKGGGGGCVEGGSLYPCGGGGGYGTFGENGRGWNDNEYRENIDGIGGNVYGDSSLTTIHFGSGGGGGYGSKGGNGGGIICISCKNKIILHENSGIYANGEKGKYYYDGCGSGGSIFIKCKYLYNENNSLCFIQAIGGKHSIEEADDAGHGGNGGFGRIRIYSQNIKNISQLKQKCIVVQPVPYIG